MAPGCTAALHTKIAEVRILVDEAVWKLDDYEREHRDTGLTGGHLEAQKARFHRLWRIHMAIERGIHRRLEETEQLSTLLRAVDALVFGRAPGHVTKDQVSLSIARELAAIPESSLHGKQIEPAAVGERGRPQVVYPSGAPSLRSLAVEQE